MKIKQITLGVLLTMTTFTAGAQQKTADLKQFTLEDLNFGGKNYHQMTAKNRWTAWWGDKPVKLDAEECALIDPQTGKEKPLFKLSDIQKQGGGEGKKVHSLYYVSFPFADKSWALIDYGKGRALYDFKAGRLIWTREIEGPVVSSDYCPTTECTAYVSNHQLCVLDGKGKTLTLTNDGSRNIVYGQSVHRDEFGWNKGTFWSPDGTKLLFTRMDQSMVTDFPLVTIPAASESLEKGKPGVIATPAPEKYPMAGQKMHKVTLGIYDLKKGTCVYLKAGDPTDRYFTNPAWSPDGKTIYLFELNRDQNDCRLVSYDAVTGEKKAELYRETDDKYVEPLHPIVFLPWDNDKFIMQSQKDGYNHLYLFNKEGKQLRQLTKGSWLVMDMLGFNTKLKSIVYASNECSPIQRNTWMVSVKDGKRTLLDNGKGWHNASLSESGLMIVDNYQEPTVPRNIDLVNVATKKTVRWFTAPDPWKGYAVPEYRCGTIKAADGKTDLYYRMVLPVGFDKNKKYPTIVYVYGGPHAHNVDARWHYCSRGWETYMAQKGYLLFILDNRGSENRGKDFEQVTFRHLGDHEVEDQMEGVKYLKSLSYVDSTRLGVHGWSFGGFMTINMMTTHPEVFKVGVAGGPVIDWKWYEVMYGERYMDTPQTNPDGYAHSSLLSKAKNLKGKLQIIIGLNDPVVVPQHALTFIKQCIQDGTQPDFFVYPGEPHNMRGHQSTHLHERISQYFDDYLK